MKYSIEGAPLPVVICDLEPGESMITEKGAMSWMTPNMKMETSGGGMGKMIGRMFSGENMFRTVIQQKADLDRLHTLPVFRVQFWHLKLEMEMR